MRGYPRGTASTHSCLPLPSQRRVLLRREDRASLYLPGESPFGADGFLQSNPVRSEAGRTIPQHPRSAASTQCHPPPRSLWLPGVTATLSGPRRSTWEPPAPKEPRTQLFLTVYDFRAETQIHVCVCVPARKLRFSQKAKRLMLEMTKGCIKMQ